MKRSELYEKIKKLKCAYTHVQSFNYSKHIIALSSARNRKEQLGSL